MPIGSRSPGFSPPHWHRFGDRRDSTPPPPDASLALPPVEIPYSWIADPIIRKPTTAITKAQIGQLGGLTAYSSAATGPVNQYGVNTAQVTLDTVCDADPLNLADFLTTYQSVPRPRQPALTFNLLNRTDSECLLILSVGLARRVRITGAPVGQPPGALNFVVEGIKHVLAVEERTVTWATSALIGVTTTDPGPWFRVGTSSLGGSDLVPF